jgi:hypothetical protein
VMIEKGKGRFIENLCIIQLCEVDLNFVLHTTWGKHLICHALNNGKLNNSQYALPGHACNNAVLNTTLFLDLSRQTLTPGILSDYDATAAFDRVIVGQSVNHFSNTTDGKTGQGVLQGSSSTGPIYILNSDISLTAYQQVGTGGAFYHPISHELFHDKTVQYVDDTSHFLNSIGAQLQSSASPKDIGHQLYPIAQKKLPGMGRLPMDVRR